MIILLNIFEKRKYVTRTSYVQTFNLKFALAFSFLSTCKHVRNTKQKNNNKIIATTKSDECTHVMTFEQKILRRIHGPKINNEGDSEIRTDQETCMEKKHK